MNGQRYRETPLDIERLRRLNRATVERYMAMKGAERLQRHSLFVEDGCAGNWTTESGEPLVFRGHESLRRLAEWLERCFPDWEWHTCGSSRPRIRTTSGSSATGAARRWSRGIRRAIARTTTSIPSNSRTAG